MVLFKIAYSLASPDKHEVAVVNPRVYHRVSPCAKEEEVSAADEGGGHPDGLEISVAHLAKHTAGYRVSHQDVAGPLRRCTHIVGYYSSVSVILYLAALAKLS